MNSSMEVYRLRIERRFALLDAAESGDYEKLSHLLSTDYINGLQEERYFGIGDSLTPLHLAAINNHHKCLEALIHHGADLTARDKFTTTALHRAAENGSYECLKALLEAGADLNATILRTHLPNGLSALFNGHVLKYFQGTTALHLAARNNHIECVKELLNSGADYNAADKYGRTSLLIAFEARLDQCALALLKYYPRHIDTLSLPRFYAGDTPLHLAVENRMVESVKELVHLGANVNRRNVKGVSPLDLSYSNVQGHSSVKEQIFKYLVLGGKNIDINYLFRKVVDKNREMAKFLIHRGVDMNVIEADKLIRREFFIPGEEDFCKCLMKCLPVVPRVCHNYRVIAYIEGDLWSSTLPDNIEIKLYLDGDSIAILVLEKGFENFAGKKSRFLRMCCLREPLVGLIYNRVTEDLENFDDSDIGRKLVHQGRAGHFAKHDLLHLKKQMWYEQMACKPPSLQHCCRFTIRKSIAGSNFKRIKELPLPEQIISYLLYES